MGDVILGHFGTKPDLAVIVLADYTAERIFLDAMYVSECMGIVEDARYRLEDADTCIFREFTLKEDDRRIMLHRQNMRRCSLEAICEQALQSQRKEWVQQPAYYGAMVLEYEARLKEIDIICVNRGLKL